MPGIYGIYNRSLRVKTNMVKSTFESMTKVLRHKKEFVHTHVDKEQIIAGKISFDDDPGCISPVWNQDKSIVSFLDGAIFSYKTEHGTEEVYDANDILQKLMAEYRQTGRIEREKINGEFNLVVIDIFQKKQIIVNDRWGFRELYIYQDNDVFVFGPEVKALLQYAGLERNLDEQGVIDFLNFGYPLGDKTLVKSISLMPPSSTISINENEIHIDTSDFNYKTTLSAESYDEHVETAYNLLDLAVQRRLRNRKNIAATLSGGLDSRIIAGLIGKNIDSFDTYSFGSSKYCKEYLIAEKAANAIPGCSNILALTKPEDIVKYAEWAVWSSDGMINLSLLCCFLGSMIDSVSNYDLLLGGFTGDLILGGSFTTEKDIYGEISEKQKIERFKFRVGGRYLRPYVNKLFSPEFGEKINYYAEKSVVEETEKLAKSNLDFAVQQDLFVILTRCRRRLNTYRGLVGHSSVEEFYPFFDDDLFDFIYSLPPELRINHKLYIDIYKRYFPDLAKIKWFKTGASLYDEESKFYHYKNKVTDKARWHVRRLTSGRINIPNSNLYTPHNDWFRTNKLLRKFIIDILLDKRTIERGYFTKKGIQFLIDKQMAGWDCFELIERFVVFELWCRQFVDGDDKHYMSDFDMDSGIFNNG